MKEKRAFTDETIQDTLPSETINLTERHPLDLTSTINAQIKSGLFLDPAVSDNLAKISASIHDTRRESRNKDFTFEYLEMDKQKDLDLFRTESILEARANIFADDFINRKQIEYSTKLEQAHRQRQLKMDILRNLAAEIPEITDNFNTNGNYYLAKRVEAALNSYYREHVPSAIASDIKSIEVSATNVLGAKSQVDTFKDISNRDFTETGAEALQRKTTYASIASSQSINDNTQEEENNKRVNEQKQMKARAVYTLALAGDDVSLETATNYILLEMNKGVTEYTGLAPLGELAKQRLEELGPNAFQARTGLKLVKLTREEALKTPEGRFMIENGHFDASVGEDGTALFLEKKYKVYNTPETQNLLNQIYLDLKKQGAPAVNTMTLDHFLERHGWISSSNELDIKNTYLNALTYNDLENGFFTRFLPAYNNIMKYGNQSQKDQANQKLYIFYSQILPAHQAIQLGRYYQNSDLYQLVNRAENKEKILLAIGNLRTKINNPGYYIEDVVPELIRLGGVLDFNGNIPTPLLRAIEKTNNDPQDYKAIYVNAYLDNIERVIKSMGDDFDANVIGNHYPEYNEHDNNISVAIQSAVVVNANGEPDSNQQAITNILSDLTAEENILEKANYQGSALLKPTINTIEKGYKEWKDISDLGKKEALTKFLATVIVKKGKTDALNSKYFANNKDGIQKYITEHLLPQVYIQSSSYSGIIEAMSSKKADPNFKKEIKDPAFDKHHLKNSKSNLSEITDQIINEYNIPPGHREAVRQTAALLASFYIENSPDKKFDVDILRSVVSANFTKSGLLKNSQYMARPLPGYASVAVSEAFALKKNAENSRDIKKLVTREDGGFNIVANATGKNIGTVTGREIPGDKAPQYEQKWAIATTITKFNRLAGDITADQDSMKIFNTVNSTLTSIRVMGKEVNGSQLYTPKQFSDLFTSALTSAKSEAVQEEFLKEKQARGDTFRKVYSEKIGTVNTMMLKEIFKEDDNIYSGHTSYDGLATFYTAEDPNKEKENIPLDFAMFVIANRSNSEVQPIISKTISTAPDGTYTGIYIKEFGGKITSDFNPERLNPVTGKVSPHNGMDVAAKEGKLVNNIAPGKIIYMGDFSTFGKVVIVQSRGGEAFLYGHLRSVNKGLKQGDTVQAQTPLGEVGQTGRTTGPCLHIERRKGVRMSPGERDNFLKGTPVHPITGQTHSEYKKEIEKRKKDPAFKAELDAYNNMIDNLALQSSKKMGYETTTLSDISKFRNTLLPGYQMSESDALAVGRTLGEDIHADDSINVLASLGVRHSKAGKIFSATNRWDAEKMAKAAVYPGTTFRFVNRDGKVTAKNMTLNDIIALNRKDGLVRYTDGEWEIENQTKELTAWLKEMGIA